MMLTCLFGKEDLIFYPSVGTLQTDTSLIETSVSGILKIKWRFTSSV